MALIQISNQSTKSLSKKSTIRFTQSICPDCNMILDAEVFEEMIKSSCQRFVQHTENVKSYILAPMICTRNLALTG